MTPRVVRLALVAALVAGGAFIMPSPVSGHCQIPCGIYDDEARIQEMLEDTQTIEKAMVQITELAAKPDAQSLNQATRWITNKEAHASNIITIVAEYFLTQKVADVAEGDEGYDEYLTKLAAHHAVMRAAMKAKQNVGAEYATNLRASIEALGKFYGHE